MCVAVKSENFVHSIDIRLEAKMDQIHVNFWLTCTIIIVFCNYLKTMEYIQVALLMQCGINTFHYKVMQYNKVPRSEPKIDMSSSRLQA